MSTVTVKIDCSGAISRLRQLKADIGANTQQLIADTTARASSVADGLVFEAYANGVIGGGKEPLDAEVNSSVDGLTGVVALTGSGRQILEYGAGDATEPPAVAGSYSETHKRQYSTKGRWYHNGIRYTAVHAMKPIFWAARDAEEYLDAHKDEVFKGKGLS